MEDPPFYREPGTEDPMLRRHRGARRAIVVGLVLLAACAAITAVPLLLGHTKLNRYFVAFGLIGVCMSLSILLLSGWDWLRTRK